jgi:hypothetical protein
VTTSGVIVPYTDLWVVFQKWTFSRKRAMMSTFFTRRISCSHSRAMPSLSE